MDPPLTRTLLLSQFNRTDVPFSQREVLGDATETGLTRFAAKYVTDFDAKREDHPAVHCTHPSHLSGSSSSLKPFLFIAEPFNSTTKTALVVVQKTHPSGPLALLIKGAPERVLERCITYLDGEGNLQPIDDAFKAAYDSAYDYMASRGHRVIAEAQLLLPGDNFPAEFEFTKANTPFDQYTFVGLVSLEDPPVRFCSFTSEGSDELTARGLGRNTVCARRSERSVWRVSRS